jgi:Glycosyl transferase family 2
MTIKCPNVPVSALPHIAAYLRDYGAVIVFTSTLSGRVYSISGGLDFSHDGNSTLTVTVTSNRAHFPSRMIVGGVRQVVEEVCEDLRRHSSCELVCVIPAHNEGPNVFKVVRAVDDSKVFDKIIVVDDGSSDSDDITKTAFTTHVVIRLPVRVGKSKAVAHALSILPKPNSLICLMDADLVGLTKEDVAALVAPVLTGKADASLSVRKSYGGLWSPSLDIFTGERVVPYSLLMECGLDTLDSMEMEMAINQKLIEKKSRIALVPWPHVVNKSKVAKYGVLAGLRREKEMYEQMFKRGPISILKQRIEMGKQLV